MSVAFSFPFEKMRKDMTSLKHSLYVACAEGVAVSLEKMIGAIKREMMGPQVLDNKGYRFKKTDEGKTIPSWAWGAATNRAKALGLWPESKRNDKGRIAADVRRGRGAVLKRLFFPKNARHRADAISLERPASPQKVWLRTAHLRKTTAWKMVANDGSMKGGLPTTMSVQGLIASGKIGSAAPYAKDVEEKFPMFKPTAEEFISSGNLKNEIDSAVKRKLSELRAKAGGRGK